MTALLNAANKAQGLLDVSRHLDFVAPLLLRIYLVPVFSSPA